MTTTATNLGNEIVEVLRNPRYRLTGIVEISRLSERDRSELLRRIKEYALPLLQQPEFANLQALGPRLITPAPDYGLDGQWGNYWDVEHYGKEGICAWIVSSMPPPELLVHLSQANRTVAPDGNSYLLRWHIARSLQALHARRDLPAVREWLAPIHKIWLPVPDPGRERWVCLEGEDRAPISQGNAFELDSACWQALTGDPLEYTLADAIGTAMAAAGMTGQCHTIRLGIARAHLRAARKAGLSRQQDLISYVTMMTLNGDALAESAAWTQAVAEASELKRPLADALQAPLSCQPR